MTRANPEILRLLPLDQVTSPKALREAFECIHPDPFEVDGAERVFRLHAAFQAENSNGAAGLVRQVLLWAHARQLDFEHFQQFRQRVGFDQPSGHFDIREDLLDAMADRIEALYAEFGQELAAWGILLLTSRPQKGGIGRLVADVQA